MCSCVSHSSLCVRILIKPSQRGFHIIPELSNSVSPPAYPGVYPGLITDQRYGKFVGALLNSTLYFLWFVSVGNGRNITGADGEQIPPVGEVSDEILMEVPSLFDRLMRDYDKNSFIRERQDCEFQEFRPSMSKPIIDEIDKILARHYGFTEEELDFIINYDIKYRMGRDSGEEEK